MTEPPIASDSDTEAPVVAVGPHHRVLTARTRILAAVVALTALGLVVSGLTALVLQTQHVDAQIDDELRRSVEQVKLLAATGVDPETGLPFDSARRVVLVAMSRTIPARHEGMVGMLDGRVDLVEHESVLLRPEDDAELIAFVADPARRASPALRSVTTSTTSWRVAVVPVVPAGAAEASEPAEGAETAEPGTPAEGQAVLILAFDRRAQIADFTSVFRTYAIVAAVALLLVAVVGWVVAGRLLRPIGLLGRTAQRITDRDLDARLAVRGNDDVAALTVAFNSMLDRLSVAIGAQRQLLDDVGHELRTPLTVVRGHLELMDTSDADDAAATRELALDEIDRMGRLVDDLVTLATIGSPDFVRPAPVDVAVLTDAVLEKARGLGDRTWQLQARAEVVVGLDAQRITQAWLQLAANAVKFSEPGSTIALGSRVSGEHLLLWVRDEGVGIEAADVDRVFARFARGDHDDVPGAGLGLAIVSAIVSGHDGTVDVASSPGVGSTFTLRLPIPPTDGAS